MTPKSTLRQVSAALVSGDTPPPTITTEDAERARDRARTSLEEARRIMDKLDRKQ